MANTVTTTAQGTLTPEQEIAALRAQIAKMREAQNAKLTFKVSEKGAISVYGLGRWPVTLYKGQMERFLDHADKIRTFIASDPKNDRGMGLASKE
jgi:hypothetical protein